MQYFNTPEEAPGVAWNPHAERVVEDALLSDGLIVGSSDEPGAETRRMHELLDAAEKGGFREAILSPQGEIPAAALEGLRAYYHRLITEANSQNEPDLSEEA